jgi:hypothetical protein
MENNIEKYYENIDKNIINRCINTNNLKNLLLLSTSNDVYLFKKKNNNWKLKDKRELLKECHCKKNKIIKEATHILKSLVTNNCIDTTREIKMHNNNLLNKIENYDSIINSIEQTFPNDYIEVYSN